MKSVAGEAVVQEKERLLENRAFVGRTEATAEPPRICVAGVIVRMSVIVVCIVLFNFFPQRIGVIVSATDPGSFVPLLSPEFAVHLPWLNLLWGLALALCGLKLYYRRWRPALRWAETGLGILAVLILFRLVIGGSIVTADPYTAGWQGVAGTPLLRIERSTLSALEVLVKVVLGLFLVSTVVSVGCRLANCFAESRLGFGSFGKPSRG